MKTITLSILSLALCLVSVHGQSFEQIAPKVPAKPGAGNGAATPSSNGTETVVVTKHGKNNPELLPNLKGLVIVSNPKEVVSKGVEGVNGVKAEGIPLLQTEEFHQVVAKYLGRSLDLNGLNLMVRDIVLYYKQNDRPLVDVSVPEQDVNSGVIQLVAVEGKVGKIIVQGNRWFSADQLAGIIRVHPGEVVRGDTIQHDAAWLNANPFRQVDLVYSPGDERGTTNIVLKVQDRFPLRAYVGYEDSGNQFTGYNRYLAGFNWGNAFGLDQQLNYQFTTNSDYDLYNAQSGSWIIPLPWRHTLTFFGSYSQSRPDTNNALFTQNGYAWQTSARYTIPLPGTNTFTEEVVGGFDFKRSNSNLFFGGTAIYNTLTDVDQFMLGYNASLTDPLGSTSLNASGFYSPGGLSSYNHSSDFALAQAGAKANYYYGLFQLNRVTKLPFDFSLANKIIGQVSSGTLIGSEQIGIGGYSTVRGYDERLVNGDSGLISVNELRTPPISPSQLMGFAGSSDQLQFLAFADYGTVTNTHAISGSGTSPNLFGVGPGVRYLYNPYLSVRFDYGFQLLDATVPGINTTGKSRMELGAILSY